MTEYSMEKLSQTFSDHSIRAEKAAAEQKKIFEENNPGMPLPDYMIDDFSLPKALAAISAEIIRIRDKR